MIPVIGIPVLNRGDLLMRCIRSIDYPFEKLVIINNGDDAGVAAVIDQLRYNGMPGLDVVKAPYNLGVAASWNYIVQHFPAEYWLLVGNDIAFTPGDLKKIDEFVRAHPEYVMCPANWGHSLFALRQACFDGAGYFDESFWPAYSEDQDHCYRIKLAGLQWADVPNVHAVHGEPPLWGSSTVWSDAQLNARCRITQKNNLEYYVRKWGGAPGEERFTHPFNEAWRSIKDCSVDRELWEANGHPLVQGGEQ